MKIKFLIFINFKKMVILTVKHATEVQFLFNVPIKTEVSKVKEELRKIYNARLKVERLATEIDQLSQFGTMLPENMQGLIILNKFLDSPGNIRLKSQILRPKRRSIC